jgi:iron(III) transport system substrate-binding protein
LQLNGEAATAQWLTGMNENAVLEDNNVSTLEAVNAGEIDGGIIYHYYWYRDQAETKEISANTALHYFRNQDPGAFISVSGGGVLASSDRPEEAQQFIRFITSRAGQEVLQQGTSFEYPVASGVSPNPALPPLDELQAPNVDLSTLDAQKVSDMMTQTGLV